jgi:hypothetical protein
MNRVYKQIWVALKIWMIAVTIDSLVGTLFLTAGSFEENGNWMLRVIALYSCLSALFSLPIFFAIIFILNRCMASEVPSQRAFLIVLLSGIGMTILVYIIFLSWIGEMDKVMLGHLLIALLSAIAGVSLQRASILRISDAN